jgi:hypothetical protein
MGRQKLILSVSLVIMAAAVIFSINRMIKVYEKDSASDIIITPGDAPVTARPAAGIAAREKKEKALPAGYKKHAEHISSTDEKGNFLQ